MLASVFIPVSVTGIAAFVAGGGVGASLTRVAGIRGAGVRDALRSIVSRFQSTSSDAATAPGGARASTPPLVAGDSVLPLRRVRSGRLPLPQRVTHLTPDDEPALGLVNEFADGLAEFPVDEWLAIGRDLLTDRDHHASRAMSYARLESTINDRGLAIAAWYVRDAVETSAYYATHSTRYWNSSGRRAFAAAHGAAEEAALALLARASLPAEDFELLSAPYARLINRASVRRQA